MKWLISCLNAILRAGLNASHHGLNLENRLPNRVLAGFVVDQDASIRETRRARLRTGSRSTARGTELGDGN